MIEICLKDDNMHRFVIINALICINIYVITCISSMLSLATTQGIATIAIANINLANLTLPLQLTKKNFMLWKTQLLPVLVAYDLMDLLDQDPPPLCYTDKDDKVCPNQVYKTSFKNDKILLSIIKSSLSKSCLPILVAKSMAEEAWMAINRNFSAKSRSRVMELQTKLHDLKNGSLSIENMFKPYEP